MKRMLARMGLRAAKRNPRGAVRLLLMAARHGGAIVRWFRAMRRGLRAFDRATAAESVMQAELRASAASLGEALTRARKVGLVEGVRDPQVAKHLDRALRHASEAVGGVRRRRRTHRGLRALVGVLPLLGGYGVWRLKSHH
jgi:hypothetical protein